MIFRRTRKLGKKIGETPSLYSILFYGRGIANGNRFIRRSISYMHEIMAGDGNEFFFRRFIEPQTGRIGFSKSWDRSATPRIAFFNSLLSMAARH